jgi:branched-chain amino acid transport system ATP-binding protein
MLELDNIVVGYGAGDVLKGLSLSVKSGEIVSLVGANGAGKSTTLRVIMGLLRPRRGTVLFNGQPINQRPAYTRARQGIALVPEGRRIFQGMTVQENLELGALRGQLGGRSVDVKTVYELFPRLDERKDQLAGSLSGGEQQMLALGRALLSRPRLLLLDEPSLGLAPLIVRHIFSVISRIHEDGTTILLVEQNISLALQTASRAYVMQTGRIVLEGTSEELRGHQMIQSAYLGRDVAHRGS